MSFFSSLSIGFSGSFSVSESDLSKLIKEHGGQVSRLITKKTSFIVTSPEEFASNSVKVSTAKAYNIPLVSEKWVHDCIKAKKLLNEVPYLFSATKDSSVTLSLADLSIKDDQYEETGVSEPLSTEEKGTSIKPPARGLLYGVSKTETKVAPKTTFKPQEKEKKETATVSATSLAPPTSKLLRNALDAENLQLKQTEDYYRALFAQRRTDPLLDDPYLSLIDAYSQFPTFSFEKMGEKEEKLPKVLDSFNRARDRVGPSIVTKEKFLENWTTFTEGVLKDLDWSNVFAAGGSVLAALDPLNASTAATPSVPSTGNTSSAFKRSDIDLFVYGLQEAEASNKLRHIFEVVKKNITAKTGVSTGDVVRTKNAVTIVGQYPYRHIQLVLRIYHSPAEVLIGFDVDCCCVGFDGDKVWILPRARRALNKGYNLVDLSRRSLTYELRLFKYSKRGFVIAVPGLDRSRVDEKIYKKKFKEVQGLAKLLVLEKNGLAAPGGSPSQPAQPTPQASKYKNTASSRLQSKDEYNALELYQHKERQDGGQEGEESDYSDVFIPWGPQWYSYQIIRLLNSKDKACFFANLFASKKSSTGFLHRHIVVSGIEGVLEGKSCWCKTCKANAGQPTTGHGVVGPLRWLTENPGRQLMTGSFHPVDDDNWDVEAYNPQFPRTDDDQDDGADDQSPFILPQAQASSSSSSSSHLPATVKPSPNVTSAPVPSVSSQPGGHHTKTVVKAVAPVTPTSQPASAPAAVEGPKSPVGKLFLLVSILFKSGKIDEEQKTKLKDLIISGSPACFSALEAFEVENDIEELSHTLKRLALH